MLIVSGIFEATPGNGLFMNEMRLSTGFMNDVTSLFVTKLCLDNHNKVAVANPQKKLGFQFDQCSYFLNILIHTPILFFLYLFANTFSLTGKLQ